MTTVKQIVLAHLKLIGADGLCCGDAGEGCGCGVDDLFPCSEDCSACVPAKLVPVPEEEREVYDCDEWYEAMA